MVGMYSDFIFLCVCMDHKTERGEEPDVYTALRGRYIKKHEAGGCMWFSLTVFKGGTVVGCCCKRYPYNSDKDICKVRHM